MEQEHSSHSHDSHEEHGHGDGEPVTIKKMTPNEMLANDLNEHGIIAEHVVQGTHPIESEPCYSHMFGMNSKFTTNRGVIRVRGKNFDLVQVLQKH
ncbi:hypothetical protein [Nitrososphaera viennensis]|uniref:Uncharacterized protein n=2 Tax=Nitrososphaera viennensis TaxID=1034015 RepID=A0A060HGJ7_9ARCH|nr:hypothetical protein [Nitrososphaera viennensis]AIC14718.1 hypothetical protein NVIE_005220 [Nitrososphaera viennensis EN76]UVS69681.1 hypothetical protein NWT39_02565 [Nitrososphaera viennensis]